MTEESFERATIVVMCSSAAAIVTAIMLGYVAHYDFGLSRGQIRTPAVAGAAAIALLIAVEYFGKNCVGRSNCSAFKLKMELNRNNPDLCALFAIAVPSFIFNRWSVFRHECNSCEVRSNGQRRC